ncbi:MAG: glycine cleavage T C-terminal barrel domain-containing protein [Caldilineaceae bacterium]
MKLEQPQRLLIGFEMIERAVPRDHYTIAVGGNVVGYVTTGMKSPTLDKFLGLGYVARDYAKLGTELEILCAANSNRRK